MIDASGFGAAASASVPEHEVTSHRSWCSPPLEEPSGVSGESWAWIAGVHHRLRIGLTEVINPPPRPMLPHDFIPLMILDPWTHHTAQGFESEGASPGFPLAGSLSLQPLLKECPSLLLAQVSHG